MKTSIILKTLTATGLLAATLTLSACDMHISFGSEGQGQEQGQEQDEGRQQGTETSADPTEETPAEESSPESDAGQEETTASDSTTSSDSTSASDSGSSSNGSSSSGSSSNGSSSSSSADNDGYEGPRIGEDGVELDQDGYGKIPADVLEKDIKNAYAKQGTTVDDVDCYADLRIIAHRGSQSCTVTAAGKENYGTVKITSATQSGISYSLEFPNV